MSDNDDLSSLAETPDEAAAEARQTELAAREAVGAELDDDDEGDIAEEEGIA